jgi:hypothetical protein
MTTPAELVEVAHKRQLAMRMEVSALEAAIAAGHTTVPGQYAYALAWLAEYAAGRLMRKEADADTTRAFHRDASIVEANVLDAARLRVAALPTAALAGARGVGRNYVLRADALNAVSKDAARAHDAAGPATPNAQSPSVAGHTTHLGGA